MDNKRSSLAIKELKGAKLVAWTKSTLSRFKISPDSRAGIVVNKSGVPQLFIFDTSALLDILSTIEEALVDRLSDKEYHSKSANPAGFLIDEIETRLPLNPECVQSLKDAIEEAERKGWIPFSRLQRTFGFK